MINVWQAELIFYCGLRAAIPVKSKLYGIYCGNAALPNGVLTMKRLLVTCALAALVSIEAGAAEYICKLPGGKTSIQGTPCTHEAKTAYKNTARYETQEEMQARVIDADRRLNEPMRREIAIQEYERAEARRQQQAEDAAKAKAEREQAQAAAERAADQAKAARELALLEEVRRAREAAEAAQAAAKRAGSSGMNCYGNGRSMHCY